MNASDPFLYQEIAEALRRRMASGELKPGDKLPPVRDMAQQWHCTPGTVSRAYAQLTREGLLVGHRGGGTRVAAGEGPAVVTTRQWASLVNRAEQFLLEALSGGYTPRQAEAALEVALARWQEWQHLPGPPAEREALPAGMNLRFAGSHDLAVEYMTRLLAETSPDAGLTSEYLGSLGGLMALARREAEIAGLHLWDEATDTYNLPFIRRLLPGCRLALVTLAHRSLGLIVPPGNPQRLASLADLAQPGVKLVNRQSGSGTRVWLDAQLKRLGLIPEAIPGYEQEELTHLGVALAVQQERATAGLGIYAAAAAYGLDFIPLTQERYDLVFLETAWQTPTAQALVNLIRSAHFKETITALGGYDMNQAGQETWLD